MFRDHFANSREQFSWNFYYCRSGITACRLIFGKRFLFSLQFVVRDHAADLLVSPALRKLILLHGRFLFLRLLCACNAPPFRNHKDAFR